MSIRGNEMFFGWKVVAAAFVSAVFAWGVSFYGIAVFLQAIHERRGWPVSTISAAITWHFLLSAVLVAWLPEVHRRFGIAAVTQAGIVATVIGVLGWSLAASPWQLFIFAIPTGAGWAATSGAAINAMVAPWFEQRRGAALSHAFNGASVGGIIFVPLWIVLIRSIGFTTAAMLIGGAMLAVLWPLTVRYVRPTPESMRLAPDGEAMVPGGSAAAHVPLRLGALMRDRRFATLSAAFALALFAQIGLIAHLVARLAPVLGDTSASIVVSLATGCAIAGRLLLAWLLGHRDRRSVAAGNFVMQAAGTTLLAFGSGPIPLVAGGVLLGLGIGNLISLPPLIAQSEFGRADVARIVALITALNQAVFAFAPVIFGVLHDLSGSYTAPFAGAACVQMLAACVVLGGRVSGKACVMAGAAPSYGCGDLCHYPGTRKMGD